MKQAIITTKARVLERINHYEEKDEPEKCYASQIARDLDKTFSHMLEILETLEEKGLVEEQSGGNDRSKLVKLSDAGKEIVQPINDISEIGQKHGIEVYYG